MKKAAGWIAFFTALAAAGTLAVVHFEPRLSALGPVVSPGPLSWAHADLGEQCETCHEPAVGVTAAKCTACHATNQRLLSRQPTAFHASIDECAACHREHGGASVRPVTMDHAELARVGARTLAGHATRDPASDETLRSLARWIGTDELERMDVVELSRALDCAGCHDRKDPHFARFGGDCVQCHDPATSWTVPGYRHPSPRSRDCVQCHKAPPSHFMGHFSMVSQRVAAKEHARVEECFECHETTAWNDIAGVGFYKHH